MLLAIDVGNTDTVLGLYDEDELIEAKERGSCIGVDWAVKIQKI